MKTWIAVFLWLSSLVPFGYSIYLWGRTDDWLLVVIMETLALALLDIAKSLMKEKP